MGGVKECLLRTAVLSEVVAEPVRLWLPAAAVAGLPKPGRFMSVNPPAHEHKLGSSGGLRWEGAVAK